MSRNNQDSFTASFFFNLGQSWWMDRNNKKRKYWDGANSSANAEGCACSINGGQCRADWLGRRVSPDWTININY